MGMGGGTLFRLLFYVFICEILFDCFSIVQQGNPCELCRVSKIVYTSGVYIVCEQDISKLNC